MQKRRSDLLEKTSIIPILYINHEEKKMLQFVKQYETYVDLISHYGSGLKKDKTHLLSKYLY